jgi:hypothetical protein
MAAAKKPPCPKIIPIPDGYRRAKQDEITKGVLTFASVALQHCLPIGKHQATIVTGPVNTAEEKKKAKGKTGERFVVAQSEWHWDNHPAGGKGPEFWHPGISILVPKDEKVAMAALNSLKSRGGVAVGGDEIGDIMAGIVPPGIETSSSFG